MLARPQNHSRFNQASAHHVRAGSRRRARTDEQVVHDQSLRPLLLAIGATSRYHFVMTIFDPELRGFVQLRDFALAGRIGVFEYRNHAVVDGSADLLRVNIYLSRDGTFVTIWNGLVEPWLAEAQFELPAPAKELLDFEQQYCEPLFRGHIETDAEAVVIFHALRLEDASRALPQLLTGAPHDLRCEQL